MFDSAWALSGVKRDIAEIWKLNARLDRKLPKPRKHLAKPKKAAPDRRLLASSKLPETKIREVIRCFAYRRTPAEAIAHTGLSHITIYRLYGYIRQRLVAYDIMLTKEAFIDFINEGEEEGPHFDWDVFAAHMRRALGQRRNIRPENRALYASEAILDFEDHYTPSQLYNLIMLTIRIGGPLNRPVVPGRDWLVIAEVMRLGLVRLRGIIRSHEANGQFDWLLPGIDGLQRKADLTFEAAAEAAPAKRRSITHARVAELRARKARGFKETK